MTVDNDMGNRAVVVETTCDNDDDVDDDAAPAATTFAADTAMRRWVNSSAIINSCPVMMVFSLHVEPSSFCTPSFFTTRMVKSKVRDINAKNASSSSRSSYGGGIDEIDSLFAAKKQCTKVIQQQIVHQEALSKLERKQRKRARLEEEAEELALRGTCSSTLLSSSSSSSSGMEGGGGMMRKGGDVAAPSHLHERAKKLSSLTYTRDDIDRLDNNGESTTKSTTTAAAVSTKEAKDSWATDGLGGVFNGEGFTGRRDDGGHRVFKAHLMNKKGFGSSPDCPFDCNCCFI